MGSGGWGQTPPLDIFAGEWGLTPFPICQVAGSDPIPQWGIEAPKEEICLSAPRMSVDPGEERAS